MRFRVLGGVEADVNGMPILLNRRRERALLGLLLLEAGQPLTVERLVDLLWDDPPGHARRTLQGHVARIRSAFSAAGVNGVPLASAGSGYLLDVDPRSVDIHRFRARVEQAKEISEPGRRARVLDEALALWRGPVLGADAGTGLRERVGASWQALHSTAIEQKHEALVEAGAAEQSLPELSALAVEHPGRERLTELLMTASYHLGRKADALASYDRMREWLAENLGVDPTPRLRETHRLILRDELPSLVAVTTGRQLPVERTGTTATPGGSSLPAPPIGFTGRDAEVATLERLLIADGASDPPAALVTGTAGIGKTALAVHVAWRIADRFSDGCHYLDLKGYAPQAPLTVREAVERLLNTLSVETSWLPDDDEAAARHLRSRLAGRRLLLVIDNAATADQVRALWPPAGCAIMVTSRNRLTGLTVDPGVSSLVLGNLPSAAAHRLLADAAGAVRMARQPEAIAEIASLCAYLPLAVRIAAANLSVNSQWDLGGFAAELRSDRLGMLDVDGDTAVRSAFETSYAGLQPAAQRMFRLLGLLPSIDVGISAAAALAGLPLREAQQLLDRLCTAHLVEQHQPRRYSLHDLMRVFARERADHDEPSGPPTAAITAVYRWYERAASAAGAAAFPQTLRTDTVNKLAAEHGDTLDARSALAWLAAERANLPVLIAHADRLGARRAAWVIHDAMRPYFRRVSALAAWETTAEHARRAAHADGDQQGLALAHQSLGDAMNARSAYDAAAEHHQRALAIAEHIGWTAGAAIAAANAGGDRGDQGNFTQARAYHERAVDAFLRSERSSSVWVVHTQLAFVDVEQGRIADATARLEQARQLCPPDLQATILLNLADIHRIQDRLDEARQYAEDGLARWRTHPNRLGEVSALAWVSHLWRDLGEFDRARQAVAKAAEQLDGGGPPRLVAEVHLATAHLSAGDAASAYQAALELALGHRLRLHEVRARLGLGHVWAALPARQSAAEHMLTTALALSRSLGLRPREGEAHAELSRLLRCRGALGEATQHADKARTLFEELGYRLALRQLS